MDITVLGVGAAFPRAGTACSGYLIRSGETSVWLDAGNGTFSRIQECIDARTIDAVILSHSHADHIADVLPLMYSRAFDDSVDRTMPLHAPPDVAKRFHGFLGSNGRMLFEQSFDVSEIAGPIEVGPLRFEPFRTVHPVETYGFRVTDGGRRFVYTADTGLFPGLAAECEGADLLVIEATYVEGKPGDGSVHLWARQAGAVAAEARSRHVLITHVWGDSDPQQAVDEAAQAYSGPLEAAEEGKTYTL